EGSLHRLPGSFIQSATTTDIAFGHFHDLFSSLSGFTPAFSSWHVTNSFRINYLTFTYKHLFLLLNWKQIFRETVSTCESSLFRRPRPGLPAADASFVSFLCSKGGGS